MFLAAAAAIAVLVGAEPIELQWSAPPGCPDADDVRARVEALLATDRHERVRARAEVIARAAGGWSLELAIEAEHGAHTHTWHAERCDVLADATALTIAVAAAPTEIAERLVPEPRAIATTPSPGRAVSAPRAPPRDDIQRTTRVQLYARVQACVGSLVLPQLDVGGAIGLGLAHRRLRVELVGGAFGPRVAELRDTGARVRMLAGTIDARGCWMAGDRVALGLCGMFEVAIVRGSGERTATPSVEHDAWLALGVGPLVQIPLAPRWQLHLGADAMFAVRRPRFAVREAPDDVAHTGATGVRGFVGIAIGTRRRTRPP